MNVTASRFQQQFAGNRDLSAVKFVNPTGLMPYKKTYG